MRKFKRIFHPFDRLEDIKNGMWRNVSNEERETYKGAAAALMRDVVAFKSSMLRAIKEWPVACENYLTNPSVNHQAFAGHIGCCIAVNSPEDVTRQAWHTLTQPEQDAANIAANEALAEWERIHAEKVS